MRFGDLVEEGSEIIVADIEEVGSQQILEVYGREVLSATEIEVKAIAHFRIEEDCFCEGTFFSKHVDGVGWDSLDDDQGNRADTDGDVFHCALPFFIIGDLRDLVPTGSIDVGTEAFLNRRDAVVTFAHASEAGILQHVEEFHYIVVVLAAIIVEATDERGQLVEFFGVGFSEVQGVGFFHHREFEFGGVAQHLSALLSLFFKAFRFVSLNLVTIL